jgi:hypothetical protein
VSQRNIQIASDTAVLTSSFLSSCNAMFEVQEIKVKMDKGTEEKGRE